MSYTFEAHENSLYRYMRADPRFKASVMAVTSGNAKKDIPVMADFIKEQLDEAIQQVSAKSGIYYDKYFTCNSDAKKMSPLWHIESFINKVLEFHEDDLKKEENAYWLPAIEAYQLLRETLKTAGVSHTNGEMQN
jgi:hypothetical protein